MRIVTLVAFTGLGLVACRSDSNNHTVDGNGGGGDGGGSGGTVHIQDVQNDAMAPGTPVALHNVVVTAIDNFGAKTGDLWVEEMGGGPFSGVHVFKAQASDVAALAVGDLVDISGAQKSEFALSSDTSGRTVTELEPVTGGMMSVKKIGTGTPITPDVVDALAIGKMSDPARSAEWEKWEGVLITVNNVSALGAPSQVGGSMPDPTLQNMSITGVAKAESSLAAFPMGIKRGDCLGSVTGVVDYFFDYLILPRSTAEVATGGSGCPALESTPALCENGMDDDGNGFADCMDLSCVTGDQMCRTSTTISAIDTAADMNPAMPTLPTGGVEITSACVTALQGTRSIYIAGAGMAAADGGLFAFNGGATGITAGSLVDVIGTVQAFKSTMSTAPEPQVELNTLQVTKLAGSCTPVALPVTSALSALTMDANGHKLIGSLVTLTAGANGSFKVTTALTGTGTTKFGKLTQGSTVISFGNSLLTGLTADPVNTCYSTITGIWTYDTTMAGSYEILPTAQPASVPCM